jgi:anaerobic selenocysteine-containing dehydrogenase
MVSRGLHEDEKSDDEMVLRLTTLRSHDQFNTTVYALNDRYRGVFGRRDIVFLNENEMIRRGLAEGDLVELVTALSFARGSHRAWIDAGQVRSARRLLRFHTIPKLSL